MVTVVDALSCCGPDPEVGVVVLGHKVFSLQKRDFRYPEKDFETEIKKTVY